MSMLGKAYTLYGELVEVVCQWRTPRKLDNADLAARYPLVLTGRRAPADARLRGAPRNLAVLRRDGSVVVIPSRPLRKPTAVKEA